MHAQEVQLSSRFDVRGAVDDGNTIRVPATILRDRIPVKGWHFGRQALQASKSDWIGKPVWVGSHASKRQVGSITESSVFGGDLVVEFSIEKQKLPDISGLSEVSLEGIAQAIAQEKDGISEGIFTDTKGVVLLTHHTGECSTVDGCGLHLSQECNCGCNGQKGGDMPEPKRETLSLAEQLKGMTPKSLLHLAAEAGIELPVDKGPSEEDIALWKGSHERLLKLEASKKTELVDGLIAGEFYKADQKETLLALSVEELEERGRLVGLGKKETPQPTMIQASRQVQGSDFTVPGGQPAAPVNLMDAIRARRNGIDANAGGAK